MIEEIVVKENQKEVIPIVWTGKETDLNYSINLVGRGADLTLLLLLQGTENNSITIRVNIFHLGKDTKSRVIVKGALTEKSKVDFEGTVKIDKGASGSKAWLAAHLLLLDGATGRAVPNMEILENEVVAGHAATVGRLNDLELFYLMSRGLSKTSASQLVIQGFLKSIIEEFPASAAKKAIKELKWI